MKNLTVVQHNSADYLGLIEDHLEGRRIRFKYFRPFTEGASPPHPDAIGDGLVLLGGGPWGSAGERDVPTLQQEITLARTCLMLSKPVIGIGLGAQILSLAAGGRSGRHPLSFEVGFAEKTYDGALNGFLPNRYPLVTYMRDRPEPPDYATVLSRDWLGRPALFQIGTNAFGFAGHPGFKQAMAEDLIMEFEEVPPNATESLEKLRGLKVAIEDALIPMMTGLIQLTGLMDI